MGDNCSRLEGTGSGEQLRFCPIWVACVSQRCDRWRWGGMMTWGLGAVEQTLGERYNRAEMRHEWRETGGNEGRLTSLVSRLHMSPGGFNFPSFLRLGRTGTLSSLSSSSPSLILSILARMLPEKLRGPWVSFSQSCLGWKSTGA